MKVTDITGITSIVHDICISTWIAYTGPCFSLKTCLECRELHHDTIQYKASGGHIQ
jgi:hypothetical protein